MFKDFGHTPSVVVAHPSVAPFVQQAALAFAEQGMLKRLITTVIDRPSSVWQSTLARLSRLLGYDLARQFHRRAVPDIPPEIILSRPWRELGRLATSRIDPTGIWTDRVFNWAETGFDRWAARAGLNGGTAAYGYEYSSCAFLEAAHKRGLFCVYDVPAPEHEFTRRILDQELERFPRLRTRYDDYIRMPHIHEPRVKRRRREWRSADLVIAASSFTRNSFEGYDCGKVCIVPYGAPPCDESGITGGSRNQGPLRFIWAGTFSMRKGAHYLLEAWRTLHLDKESAVVDVYGAVKMPASLMDQLPDSVRIRGGVPRTELLEAYKRADALLFPTLCDGFGMVVTEAFSRGLPVLTTHNAGAGDFVTPERNGLLVSPGDTEALAAGLEWCLENRSLLASMRPEALKAAASWQWTNYRSTLADILVDRFNCWCHPIPRARRGNRISTSGERCPA